MPAFRTVFKALLYLFAVIGFVDVCGRLLLWPIIGEIYSYRTRLPSDVAIVSIVPSADRSLQAIVYMWTGSGLDPGCGEFVSVLEGSSPEAAGWGEDNRVFANDTCDNSLKMTWEPPADGRVKPRLRINADPAKATLMSRLALRGTVAVAYRNDP
jgi:hypothetical protein